MQIYLQNGAFFMEPWKLIKTDPDRTATVLNLALQIAANLDIAFEPFLLFSSERLRRMLDRGFEKAIKTRKTVLKTVLLFCSGARD